MLVTALICGFVLGVVVTLIIQVLIVRAQLSKTPVEPVPVKPQFVDFELPQELLKALTDPKQKGKKESCMALNLIIHFLYKELRDTKFIRRWMIKKMNVEFAELMQKTTGKILEQISVQEFSIGPAFPVIKSVAVRDVKLEKDLLEVLDVEVDLEYQGGFQLAVDVDLVLGKRVYLSVTVTKLQGQARLQFTRVPYTHWSFSFYEDPLIEFAVESKYGGRATPQITSLIVTQLRRTLRKKHTLPNYKFRMKPFFTPPTTNSALMDMYVNGKKIGQGKLEVTVKECSRLIDVPTDSFMYCTLSVDSFPWVELIEIRKKVWVTHDIEIHKGQATSIGITFKDDFLLEKYEDVVMVDSVQSETPASLADVRKGDILLSVGTTKITSTKQAAKLFKNTGERFILRIERQKSKGIPTQELHFFEESVSVKDLQSERSREDMSSEMSDDFVNISLKSDTEKQTSKDSSVSSSPQKRVLSLVNSGKALLQRRQRSNTAGELTSSSNPINAPPRRSSSPQPIHRTPSDKEFNSSSPNMSPKREFKEKGPVGSRNQSDTISLKSTHSGDFTDGTISDDTDSEGEEESSEIIRTVQIPACKDPSWNEKFNFSVGHLEKYLNVCIWCKIPGKADKQERVKRSKELLMGHVSISLLDIALDCLMTLQGDTQQTFKLKPTEARAGASRAKFPGFSAHPGFDPNMCCGDITLSFKHSPNKLTEQDKKVLTRKTPVPKPAEVQITKPTVQVKETAPEEKVKQIEIGKHDFTGTNFNTATYCNFCGKKIWLKVAFRCYTCSMICHKKCVLKCQEQTLCTKEGPMIRSKPTQPWKPPVLEKRQRQEESGQKSGGILSKFRKDPSLERKTTPASTAPNIPTAKIPEKIPIPKSPLKLSPQSSPPAVRRRNSAPNAEAQISQDQADTLDSRAQGRMLPHTHSATSLQGLLNKYALPKTSSYEPGSKNADYDSSDDSDLEMEEMLQIAQQHRSKGQNLDEMVVTAAKEMGKELFAELSLEERKEKLDSMVSKLQKEIDTESENKSELMKAEEETIDLSLKAALSHQISKSEEKVEAMMMMMLHYCAGLQYCLDQEEEEKRKMKDKSGAAQPMNAEERASASQAQPVNAEERASRSQAQPMNTEEMPTEAQTQQMITEELKQTLSDIDKLTMKSSSSEESVTEGVKIKDDQHMNKSEEVLRLPLDTGDKIQCPEILVHDASSPESPSDELSEQGQVNDVKEDHLSDLKDTDKVTDQIDNGTTTQKGQVHDDRAMQEGKVDSDMTKQNGKEVNDTAVQRDQVYMGVQGTSTVQSPEDDCMQEEDLFSEVLFGVTEIVEASGGETDSSDEDDIHQTTSL